MTLSEYIGKLCKERGIKKHELARDVGFSKHVFYNWENGRSKPKESALIAMAEVLQVSPEELFRLAKELATKKPIERKTTQPTKKQFIKNLNAAIAKRKKQRKNWERQEERKRTHDKDLEYSGYLNDLSRDKLETRRWLSCHNFNEV